jgi:hypothetical protein
MLEWKQIESKEFLAIGSDYRYNVIYLQSNMTWSVLYSDGNGLPINWLDKNSKPLSTNYGHFLDEHKFHTKEEAISAAERHYKLLILQ